MAACLIEFGNIRNMQLVQLLKKSQIWEDNEIWWNWEVVNARAMDSIDGCLWFCMVAIDGRICIHTGPTAPAASTEKKGSCVMSRYKVIINRSFHTH